MNSHIYYSENKVIRFFCGIQLIIIKTCSTNHKILHVTLNMQLKLTIRQSDNENQKKIHEEKYIKCHLCYCEKLLRACILI